MNNQLYCPDENRKALIAAEGTINAIDFLEVLDDDAPANSPPQRTLLVHCFLPIPALTANNVTIEGGVRFRDISVQWAHPANAVPPVLLNLAEQTYLAALPNNDRILVVRTNHEGDFSTYTLRLVASQSPNAGPPPGFDLLLSSVDFNFKVDCPSEFDCRSQAICPTPTTPVPQIDYLSRDYASIRRLLLDRLSVLMPDWTERNPADILVTLVELFAFVGDRLHYEQDSVSTEAYLGTARRRVSLRRHARLLDYPVHEGANARAWVAFQVTPSGDADGAVIPASSKILTRDPSGALTVHPDKLFDALSQAPVVFETLHSVTLRSARNRISFHTWGDPRCCLPKGATSAALRGDAATLGLRKGDVLVFMEELGAPSGLAENKDPSKRHAVRITQDPVEITDPLGPAMAVEVRWHDDDALPFPLCLWQFPDPAGGTQTATVALANVVLADHGLSIPEEPLIPAAAPDAPRLYRPRLDRPNLTHALPYDHEQAATQAAVSLLAAAPRDAVPFVTLNGDGRAWVPRRDLLASNRFAPEFVVEMEENGRAYIRFGDGILGLRPAPRSTFTAVYRTGNGTHGNVGADSLTRLVTTLTGFTSIGNPLPASGGLDPEPIDQVRLFAPDAFRSQQRAVTLGDWEEAAKINSQVQRAAASRRWTGSWYTIFLTVDRDGGREVTSDFETLLRAQLDRYRMAGVDLEIDAPRFVALDLFFTVCVKSGYLRASVKQALLEAFSNRDLPDGTRGFFHPNNFTFGQAVYLSQVVANAMRVPGVEWIDTSPAGPTPARFQRYGEPEHGEIAEGRIVFDRLEIPRLDNDPNLPENGRIDFAMRGGL